MAKRSAPEPAQAAPPTVDGGEFDRFVTLTKRLLTVEKKDLDAERKREKNPPR